MKILKLTFLTKNTFFFISLKNAEKEQKAYFLTRKNDADFSAIYEMHLTNESNLKKHRNFHNKQNMKIFAVFYICVFLPKLKENPK